MFVTGLGLRALRCAALWADGHAGAARRPCDRVAPLQDCLAVATVGLLAVLALTALEPLRVSSGSLSPMLVPGDQVVDKIPSG